MQEIGVSPIHLDRGFYVLEILGLVTEEVSGEELVKPLVRPVEDQYCACPELGSVVVQVMLALEIEPSKFAHRGVVTLVV